MKKPKRKTTARERALVRAVREVIRSYSFGRCGDCWAELPDERHDSDCFIVSLKHAARVK